ncbi:transposase, partial [Rhodococcus koreensis]|uniref:transposase n=1 Tax=Rhodococcus koreensis TaxID=99653 RepID=UPI00366C0DFA
MSISAIGRKLSLNRRTVRRSVRATDVEELLAKTRFRTSLLDQFKPYLHERFNAGCTDAARLTCEIVELGYRGSDNTVRRYLQSLRDAHNALPPAAVAPIIRQTTGWPTRRPDRLTDDEREQLNAPLGRSPALTTTRELVHDFAEIMTDRRGGDLAAWMTAVDADGQPALRSFVRGLRRDLDAVTAGLTLPHSSGAVEGHVNRIILWNLTCQGHSRLRWLTEMIGS